MHFAESNGAYNNYLYVNSQKQTDILRDGNEWASAIIWRGNVGWLTHAAAAGNSVV